MNTKKPTLPVTPIPNNSYFMSYNIKTEYSCTAMWKKDSNFAVLIRITTITHSQNEYYGIEQNLYRRALEQRNQCQ